MRDRCFNLINRLRYSTHDGSKKTVNEMVKLTEPLGISNEDTKHRWLGCLLKSVTSFCGRLQISWIHRLYFARKMMKNFASGELLRPYTTCIFTHYVLVLFSVECMVSDLRKRARMLVRRLIDVHDDRTNGTTTKHIVTFGVEIPV